jgi:putative tricarboxylic transport membrane protein
MSESPSQAGAIAASDRLRKSHCLQIGVGLLAASAIFWSIVFGWLPNFLSPLDVTPEFLRYVAEPTGVYGLLFLLIGVTGLPGSPRDYFGGAMLIALAIFALEASRELPGLRGFAFGPGTAPRMFAIVLGLLGLGVTAIGFLTKGPGIDRFYLRGPFFITLSVILFAWLVRPLGLIIASFLSICAAAGATPEARPLETIVWGVVLTAFCAFLFPYALNLPMQLGPTTCDPTVFFKGQPFVCDPAALLKSLSSIR